MNEGGYSFTTWEPPVRGRVARAVLLFGAWCCLIGGSALCVLIFMVFIGMPVLGAVVKWLGG